MPKLFYLNSSKLIVCLVMFLLIQQYAYLQEIKPDNQKPMPKEGLNKTKVELTFDNQEFVGNMPSGNKYGYTVRHPKISLNGGKPKDYNGKDMLKVFENCEQARNEVRNYLLAKKKAKLYSVGGFLLGTGLAFGGIIAAANIDQSGGMGTGAAFGVGFTLGLGSFITGYFVSRKYKSRRDSHILSSVEKYNLLCYSPN